MAEHDSIDAPDTDQIPVQTAPDAAAPAGRTPTGGPARTPTGQHRSPGAQPPAARTSPEGEPASGPGAPAAGPVAPTGAQTYHRVRRTRFSGLWVGATVAAVVLLVLLVFIIENSQTVNISFFGAHGHLSLGVALLLAAICGVLLVAVPGYGRIIQLRRALKRTATNADTPPRG